MTLNIFCDGGSRNNPGHAASAFVAKDQDDKIVKTASCYLGIATNNEAEYGGVILALEWLLTLPKKEPFSVKFYLDSNLVVNQLSGRFKMKSEKLRGLLLKIRELEGQISNISYQHIRREENKEADRLVNEELDKKMVSD